MTDNATKQGPFEVQAPRLMTVKHADIPGLLYFWPQLDTQAYFLRTLGQAHTISVLNQERAVFLDALLTKPFDAAVSDFIAYSKKRKNGWNHDRRTGSAYGKKLLDFYNFMKGNGLPEGRITLLSDSLSGDPNRLVVYDGNHRLIIANKLGLDIEADVFTCEYWLRQEWWMRNRKDPKYHLYQSIFLDRKEIAIGQRRDALDRMDAVRREDIEGKSVLVLGCNNAHDCFMVGELGATRIHGVDINAEELNYAMRINTYYGLPVTLQQFDLRQPYDAGQFDTILAFSVYDKLDKPALVQTLKMAGGVIYFEGHCLNKPILSDADYRKHYDSVLSHFDDIEPVRETPDRVRRMYRITQ